MSTALGLAAALLAAGSPDVDFPTPRPPRRAPAPASPRAAMPRLPVTRIQLEDGLTVLLHEDHHLPTVALYTIYRVGSRNERPGITGLSHLFEHMMFNGSERFPPKTFDRVIEAGGGRSNASTSWDTTDYIDEFSPGSLERVLEMEADRMRALKLDAANLEQERGIVINERLVSTDNDVEGTLSERLWAQAFVASPYGWPVVGWLKDLQTGIRLDDARSYFKTYYAPNNAVLVLAGDFAPGPALARIVKLWAEVPAAEPPRPVEDPEPEQLGEQRVVVKREAQAPMVEVGFKVPGLLGPRAGDLPAAQLLGTLLGNGRSSPLYRLLVEQTELCTSASFSVPEMAMTGLATFTCPLAPGKDPAAVERELSQILSALATDGPAPAELARAKAQTEADFLRQLVGDAGRATVLGYYQLMHGSWEAMYRDLEALRNATAADVARVAKTYFTASNRTVAVLVPQEAEDSIDVAGEPGAKDAKEQP